MNQTIAFQSRVLFQVSGFHKKKMQKNTHIFCERPVHQSSEMKDFATFHSLLTTWKQLIFKIRNVNGLSRCF